MSELKRRYRLTSQDIICEEFDSEIVILNLSTGHYFALNSSASILLNGLLRGITPEAMLSLVSARFTAEEVNAFFRELMAHELVAADLSQTPVPLDQTFRKAFQLLLEKPSLEIHSDLADLIIADPIHDSDEKSGWPVRKAA